MINIVSIPRFHFYLAVIAIVSNVFMHECSSDRTRFRLQSVLKSPEWQGHLFVTTAIRLFLAMEYGLIAIHIISLSWLAYDVFIREEDERYIELPAKEYDSDGDELSPVKTSPHIRAKYFKNRRNKDNKRNY